MIQLINLLKPFHTLSDYLEKLFENDRYFRLNLLKFTKIDRIFISNLLKNFKKFTEFLDQIYYNIT